MSRVCWFLLVMLLVNHASASGPLSFEATVNGENIISGIVELHASETINVSAAVRNTGNESVHIYGIDVESDPSFVGILANEIIRENMDNSFNIASGAYTGEEMSIQLPSILPSGDYGVEATVHYSVGDDNMTDEYSTTVRIPSDGFFSDILGFIMRAIPEDVSLSVFRGIMEELREMPLVE